MTWFAVQVVELNNDYIAAKAHTKTADERRSQASSAWANNLDHQAIGHLVGAMSGVIQALHQVINGTDFHFAAPFLPDLLELCWEYDTDEIPGVTADSICEAWGADDFEGRTQTIAFIDRMRQLVWNEPFKVIWAAKPEEEFDFE